MTTYIQIQTQDFDQNQCYQQLAQGSQAGAIATFVGRVREFKADAALGLWLEHYPGMTEAILRQIAAQAAERWAILNVNIVHRVGQLLPQEQIVFVGVAARHRKEAFAACEFIMDFLKTQAPFWKKEGNDWVKAKQTDQDAADAWYEQTNGYL